MPKEKIQIDNTIKKNKEFYYEGIGLFIILLTFIIFVEIGRVGLVLKIIFKFLFGDWYFLILGYILFSGVYYLTKHKILKSTNLRVNGFFILVFGLMLLSQQSIYEYIEINNLKGFAGVWELYLSYIKYYDNSFVMGGGLVGALFYTLFEFLLGNIGIIVFSVFLLLVGFIFMTNNTIFSFFKKMNVNLKMLDDIPNFFQRYINKLDLSNVGVNLKNNKKNINNSKIKVSINNLTDINNTMNIKMQEQFSNELSNVINNLLEIQNIEFKAIKVEIGYQATRYSYKILYNFNYELFKNKLIEILDLKPYISYIDDILIIELKNKFKNLFTLRKALEEKIDINLIPIGIKLNKNILYFDLNYDKHLYVIGEKKGGLNTFFRSFLISLMIKSKFNSYYIIDLKKTAEELKVINNINYTYINSLSYLEELLEKLNLKLEERIEIFNYYKIVDFKDIEIVKFDGGFIKPERIFIFLTGIEEIYRSNAYNIYENKLLYLLSVGEKYGINFIIFEYEKIPFESKIKVYLSKFLIFKSNSLDRIIKLINNDYSMYLSGNGDALYKDNLLIDRIQTPYVSKTEYLKIINKIK